MHRLTIQVPLTLALACSSSPEHDDLRSPAPAPEAQAPAAIAASFTVERGAAATPGPRDAARIGIAVASLEREFLLQASMIHQSLFPSWNGGKSRVVTFAERDGRLVMLEASKGHSLHDDLPQYLLLAEFPITQRTETHVFFDFNAGMSQIFTRSDWYASDFSGEWSKADSWRAVTARHSYLEDARLSPGERLEITQVAQIERRAGAELDLPTIVVRYDLTPYAPDPGFAPRRSPGFDRVGFFEVEPQLKRGGGRDLLQARSE